MKITAVHVEDYKRIRKVELRPDADRTLLLIGGKNAQGKTSLLDALTVAFGGKAAAAADPVRHGAEMADIRVELDNGAITVRRTIEPDGSSKLEVREDGVTVRAPQAMLDKLVGARFLDPLAFLAMSAKDQRAQILAMVGDADRLAELAKKRTRAEDARRDHGRDLKRSEAQLAGMPEVDDDLPEDGVDGSGQLVAEMNRLAETIRARDAAESRARAAAAEVDRFGARAARIAGEIARLQQELEAEEAAGKKAVERWEEEKEILQKLRTAAAGAEARRAALSQQAAQIDARNRERAESEAAARRRAGLVEEVKNLRAKHAEAEAAIVAVDQRRAEILAAAALPVPGLSIDDDGVTLNGVPFVQASGAERLRVAMGLAMSTAPGLRDVWVRDGALLDEESLRDVAELAEKLGVRVWMERVGAGDPGAVIIRDGGVA